MASWFAREVLLAPVEPVLHDSMFRIRIFSIGLVIGEPLYYWIWTVWSPQPAESLFIRATSALAAFPLAFKAIHSAMGPRAVGWYWSALCFYTMPLSFFCLYVMNGFNEVWMASCVAMIYILFHVTDWRISLAQIAVAVAGTTALHATGLVALPAGEVQPIPDAHLAILGFAVATAAVFAMSSANLRRVRARSALVTMGVLAHEFRTPLAGAALVAESIGTTNNDTTGRLAPAVAKLRDLFASMNALIDYQMGNARLMDMPREKEVADIGALTAAAVSSYPLTTASTRKALKVETERGLYARVHRDLMKQVIYNLVSNALKAVTQKRKEVAHGDVLVRAYRSKSGAIRVEVIDVGIGIPADRIGRVFEPFESSSHVPSHGLGLTMCRNAVTSFGGDITCTSVEGEGSTFVVELPTSATSA